MARGLMLAFGAAQAILVARWLGPEGRGFLAMTLLVTNIGALLLSGGAQTTLVFHVASDRLSLREAMGHVWSLVLASALVTSAVGLLGHVVGSWEAAFPGLSTGLLIAGLVGVPLTIANEQVRSLLQARRWTSAFNRLAVGHTGAALLATVVALTLLSGDELEVAVGLLIATGAIAVAAIAHIPASERTWRPRLCRDVLSDLWSYGRAAHVATTAQFLNYRLDLLLVAVLLGPVEAGIYVVALRLAELLWVVPEAAGIVLLPRVAASDTVGTRRLLQVTVGAAVAGAATLFTTGSWLIPALFGEPFAPAYRSMTLLLPGAIALAAAKVLTSAIAGAGHPRVNAIASLSGLLVAVTLDLVLIPRHGLVGAAVATSLSYSLILAVAVLGFKKTSPGASASTGTSPER